MSDRRTVRDFGMVPEWGEPAPGPIRTEFRGFSRVAQIGCGGGMVLFFLVISAVALAVGVIRSDQGAGFVAGFLFIGILFAAGAGGMIYQLADTVSWIELDGDTITARRLFTRELYRRDVGEIVQVTTIVALVRTPSVAIAERVLGRIRGFRLEFEDVPRGLTAQTPEMSNVEPFLKALYAAMARRGKLRADYVERDGRPIVSRVTWADHDDVNLA